MAAYWEKTECLAFDADAAPKSSVAGATREARCCRAAIDV